MRLFWDVFAPLPVTIRANVYQVTIEITHPPGMNFGADFLQNYGRIHNENGGFAKISCLGSFHSLWRMHRSAFTPRPALNYQREEGGGVSRGLRNQLGNSTEGVLYGTFTFKLNCIL